MNYKLYKQLGAALLTVTIAASSCIGASACCGLYVGSEKSANGSTYVGRSEDIGKLYDKVFDVHQAADHAEGEMYEDTYGFTMPFPAHTYRYTVMRDSYNAGETMQDENGSYIGEAYGEVGVNENGVAVSATVSTYLPSCETDPLLDTGICEISLNSVILMQATSARDGVEKLAAIIDEYGAGEYNSLTISDANEVWDFEILSGHQYAAYRMPADKVSVNPNRLIMREINVADTENVIASENLIKLAQDNGFLVSSQLDSEDEVTKIDVAKSYGKDIGKFDSRYWQGVNYLNPALTAANDQLTVGDMLLDTDKTFSTYDALRLLGYRGEGSAHDSSVTGDYAIGNDNQAECHVFEIRDDMPEALSIIQWQTMSRAEFAVYLPFYSNLLTETSDLFKTEYLPDIADIEEVIDDEDFPTDSIYWTFAALNDLCDNDRARYGANVKVFWEGYQKALIGQQEAVDEAMSAIYAYSPALAEEKATALGKAVSEEAFGYAKSMLAELRAFIAENGNNDEVFMPSVLTEGVKPTYSIDMVGGTGIPSSSSGSSKRTLTFNTNGGSSIAKVTKTKGTEIDLSDYAPTRDGYTFDGWYSDSKLTEQVSSVTLSANTTVFAKWIKNAAEPVFGDVAFSDWYTDAVTYVADKGIMSGTDASTFAPNAKLTRAMIAQVLYSLEGKPAAEGAPFTDVAADVWFADAVNWAAAQEIVSGYGNGKFGPNDNITREQMALILFGYAKSKSYDVSASGDITAFTDGAAISDWAKDSVQWAVGAKLLSGKGGAILDPKGTATRAEVAQILMAFCENIAM